MDLVDPKDKKKIVPNGQVEGVIGGKFHFKKIEKGVCKVAMWRVVDGNIQLFVPNEDDCPPQRILKDVERTCMLWEKKTYLYFTE